LSFFIVELNFLGFGQKITIQTSLDTNKTEIGERVQLKYILEKDKHDVILLPEFSDTLIEGVEVLEQASIDSVNLKNNKVRVEQKLLITSFEEGMYYIPPQAFILKSKALTDTIFSQASYIEVVGVAIDTTNSIRDISASESAPIILRDFLPLFVLMALVAIALVIVFIIRRMKKKKGLLDSPEKPKEPAHIIAFRELDKLKAQKLWQQKQVKEYYSRLTQIIRIYIENRYGILAMEKPSSEILIELRNLGFGKDINLTEFENLLILADIIKFAKGDARPEENIEHIENAYKLVKDTYKPIDEGNMETEKTDLTE
jgi:hypothetical protein